MSYVEDRRIPYRAQCACGEGFLRYYKTSNGWGYDTSVELKCAHCQRKYRYEKYNGIDFLIPKELIIELQGPHHSKAGYYDEYGLFVEDSSERGKRNFERQKNYDEKKMSFCIQHEIKLERIGYTYGRSYEILKEKIIRILSKHNFPIK